MSMQPEQGINRELGLGEAISKTFQVFRQDFAKYFVLYAVVGIIVQVATNLAQQAFVAPRLPVNPTPQQVSNFFSGLFGALFLLIGVIFVVNIIFSTIAQGTAITMASEQITKGEASLGASITFAASKLLSMSRSRQLVSHRWAKTFGTFLVLGIIVIIASLIFGAITSPFGIAGTIVNGILTALYQPLFPILLAVYYYSNLARTAQAQAPPAQMPMAPTTPLQAGMKLCPVCGAQNVSSATFCTKCGAKLN